MSVLPKRAAILCVLAMLGLGISAAPVAAAAETNWRIADLTPSFDGREFQDIVATGPNDAWAVGTGPCCPTDERLVSHWDGVSWQPVTLPDLPPVIRFPGLSTVGASSPDNVWVFGKDEFGPAFGEHWDGTTWQTTIFGTDDGIRDSAVISPTDAWFTGRTSGVPFIEHYDGTQWTKSALPDGLVDVDQISATSANNVWALGTDGSGPVSLHWDGSAWQKLALPNPPLDPGVHTVQNNIVAVGPRNVWATGALAHDGLIPGPVLWHWNGQRWATVMIDAPQDFLTRIAPDGEGGLWIVSSGVRPSADLLHYTDPTVTRQPAPVEPGTVANVDQIVLIPGTHSLWGAGSLTTEQGNSAAAVYRHDPAA